MAAIMLAIAGLLTREVAALSAADYYIHALPGAPEPLLKMHAGHVTVTPEHNGNLFFWHYQNRHIGDRQRTVIWLNGGPGCSSMDGAMMEIGPYRVNKDGTLRYNNGSWDEFANLLFIDNPVGTGFSYVDTDSYIHELQTMADQMIVFLDKWFGMFPEYSHDDLYIAGESYAGQHIPYIAKAIQARNAGSPHPWNLKGLLIGNGWIAPPDQYLSYLPFAYKEGLIQGGSEAAKKVEEQQTVCTEALNKQDPNKPRVDTAVCELILQEILRVTGEGSGSSATCLNMYDVRLRDSAPSCGMNWPPDLEQVTPYLRRKEVLDALHIDSKQVPGWAECSGAVSGAFTAAESRPSIELLPGLLAEIPIVLFSGAKDLICNHIGTESLIRDMQWNGGTGFELSGPGSEWAPKQNWTFEGEAAGIWQSARNLTYVLFYNSSHMVPFDYPRRTRDMLDRFMGVDIASVGGPPTDSRIDGEKGIETSVGGHPNSTQAQQDQQQQLEQATRKAYYKSGEVALVVVLIAAGIWAYFVWRARSKRHGYRGLANGHANGGPLGGVTRGLESFGKRRRLDVEAADFDINELDDLERSGREHDMERERYDIGSDEEDEGTPLEKNRGN